MINNWVKQQSALKRQQGTIEKDILSSFKQQCTSTDDILFLLPDTPSTADLLSEYKISQLTGLVSTLNMSFISFDKLSILLKKVDSSFADIKQTIADGLYQLNQEERSLTAEINSLKTLTERHIMNTDSSVEYLELEYQDFIKKYGKTGGWDQYSHLVFMQLRHRPDYVDAVARKLCLTADSVLEHDKWYCSFLAAKKIHEDMIQNWRVNKVTKVEKVSTQNEEEQAEMHRAKSTQIDRQKIKEELDQWKAEKVKQEQLKQEAEQREFEEQKKKEEQEIKKRKTELKKRLSLMKKEKEEKSEKKAQFETAVEKIKVDSVELRKKTEDQLEMFKTRIKQREDSKREAEEAAKKRLNALKVPVTRKIGEYIKNIQGEHYLQSTKATESYKKSSRDEDASSFFLPGRGSVGVRSLPHRQVPSWRSGEK